MLLQTGDVAQKTLHDTGCTVPQRYHDKVSAKGHYMNAQGHQVNSNHGPGALPALAHDTQTQIHLTTAR